jgi:hypothetical protein
LVVNAPPFAVEPPMLEVVVAVATVVAAAEAVAVVVVDVAAVFDGLLFATVIVDLLLIVDVVALVTDSVRVAGVIGFATAVAAVEPAGIDWRFRLIDGPRAALTLPTLSAVLSRTFNSGSLEAIINNILAAAAAMRHTQTNLRVAAEIYEFQRLVGFFGSH